MSGNKQVGVALLCSILSLCFGAELPLENNEQYTWWCVGNCDKIPSIVNPTYGFEKITVNLFCTNSYEGLILMGGGSDVDSAYIWMIEKMGGGDFVILRTSGS